MKTDDPTGKDEAWLSLFAGLADVRWRFDQDQDDWRPLLLKALRDYCRAIGFGRDALDPLQLMWFEEISWAGKKPLAEASAMAMAAAVVTVLYERRDCSSVDDAIAAVVGRSGAKIKKETLKKFRQNISSSRKGPNLRKEIVQAYDICLNAIRDWPKDALLEAVSDLGRFVR